MKNQFEIGQQIETEIVAISNDTIFIDLGLKSEGFVEKAEFIDSNGNLTVKEGDKIKVYFVSNKNDELLFTSKLKGQNADSSVLENAFNNKIPVEGTVTKEIKGGFEVSIGNTKTFCPYSQMGYKQKKEANEYVGNHLTFLIQEYKNEGRNIIVSNRAILEQEENDNLEKLSQELVEGNIVKGTVKSIESYGAFIDINGFQALLPISEISRTRINDINQVLKIGEEITAKIIKADWKHQRVSLSKKELEADPWDAVSQSLKIGQKLDGKISRVADFGLFINLLPGVDGLIHISSLPVERNTNLKKVYNVGDTIPISINKIDLEEKRISLEPIVSNEEEENAKDYLASQKDRKSVV